MPHLTLLFVALALTHATAFAEQVPPESTESGDMFVMPAQPTEAEKLEAHCKSLQAKMKELKNRPLRRSAVADRYKLECQDAPYGGR